MPEYILTQENRDRLTELIIESNGKLVDTANRNANQAFNLGCTVGLIPAGILILLAYILSNNSWIAAAIMTCLMLIALVGLANFASATAKSNTIKHTYQNSVMSEIDQVLKQLQVSRDDFNMLVIEILPETTPLRTSLQI